MKKIQFFLLLALSVMLALVSSPAQAGAGAKSNPNLELARQLNQAFVQVAEDVSPSVVVITTIPKPLSFRLGSGGGADENQDPMDQFRRFFRQTPEETPDRAPERGSGVIIREDGFILTNRHVVEDADQIEVRLKDGRTFKATVRGVDGPSDVAVVKIDAKNLPAAKFADSAKTRVGEFAIAIGAPFALDYSVTFGHVSAKDRSNILPSDLEGPGALTDQNFIQTDANINPGNSGGPLINIEGEVIGINTLIRGLRTGIGFAIPSNLAREVADQLIDQGKFTRAWLGIVIASLRENTGFRELVPGVDDGVIVREIVLNGPAAKSELQAADVITAIDGKPVVTSQELKETIRTKKVGQEVTLSVFRQVNGEGRRLKVIVKPGEWTEQPAAPILSESQPAEERPRDSLGLTVDVLRHRTPGIEGVTVTRLDPDSIAGRSSIRPGDIITSVGGQAVREPKEYYDAAKKADLKKGVIIKFISRGAARFELLKEGGG